MTRWEWSVRVIEGVIVGGAFFALTLWALSHL